VWLNHDLGRATTVKGSKRDPVKERFWREAIVGQTRSAQSIRHFCREHELTESAFYFWRRELRQRDATKPASRNGRRPRTARKASVFNGSDSVDGREMFVPVSVARSNRQSSLAATGSTKEAAIPMIEMILPSGAVLRWPGNDIDAAAGMIAAVEARLC
jgi:hypothetical protein